MNMRSIVGVACAAVAITAAMPAVAFADGDVVTPNFEQAIPNIPGKWKEVIHDNTVTWLATWTENINGNHKYVFLAAGSSLKGQSDMSKFEKSRELKVSIRTRSGCPSLTLCLRNMSNAFVRITKRI